MSKDPVYDQRWEFRRKESDSDSSSDEKDSSSDINRKLNNTNHFLGLVQPEDENEEETSPNPEPIPPSKRPKTRSNPARKTRDPKPKKCPKKNESGYKYNSDNAIQALKNHVKVLVNELNTSRERLAKWMEDELNKLVPENPKAPPSKKGKRQITKTPCRKTASPEKGFLPSSYLNSLPNLAPRPLAENYLVKPNCTSTLRLEPVVLNSSKDPYSSSFGGYGGFPSASHLGLGGFNNRNLGLSGSDFSAQENTFSGLSNNHLKYSS